jgi:hypothetical protein
LHIWALPAGVTIQDPNAGSERAILPGLSQLGLLSDLPNVIVVSPVVILAGAVVGVHSGV